MISRFSQSEVILLARLNRFQLANIVRGYTIDQLLNYRRDIQIAIAERARTQRYDAIQEKLLTICQKLEKWARLAFLRGKLGYDFGSAPKIIKERDVARARKYKAEWEKIIMGRSY